MTYTTDPNDPRLGHGVDDEKTPQHEVYLILSDEERAKGYIRPVRRTYIHVGQGGKVGKGAEGDIVVGNGCGTATTMATPFAETYARNPKFYGSTYCCGCQKHLLVEEFCWEDGTVVGS